MSWVELDTNAHSRAETTQVVSGRSGGFNVNYGAGANGEAGIPQWVYIAGALAVVYMLTRRKT